MRGAHSPIDQRLSNERANSEGLRDMLDIQSLGIEPVVFAEEGVGIAIPCRARGAIRAPHRCTAEILGLLLPFRGNPDYRGGDWLLVYQPLAVPAGHPDSALVANADTIRVHGREVRR
jgi:hypothetical protein